MSLTSDWFYWVQLVGVLAVNAVLVYVAWWALFSDRRTSRAPGTRRCPRCWYDMAHSPGMTCAECGHTAKLERDLHKPRRRYGIAALAIVLSVASAAYVNERVVQRGWTAALPTRALLWMTPLASSDNSAILNELARRAIGGELDSSQWAAFMSRCASGDWLNRPVSDGWAHKYGDFILNWRTSFVSDPKLEMLLMNIPPRIDAKTRETWPLGMPVSVSVNVRDWWPAGYEVRIKAVPRLNGGPADESKSVIFFRTSDARLFRSAYTLHLPPLAPETKEIAFDFEIARRRPASGRGGASSPPSADDWQSVDLQTVTMPVKIQGDLAELSKPVSGETLAIGMMGVFNDGVSKWASGASPVRFRINMQSTFTHHFNDTAVGVSAELMCDGEVARRLNLWWLGGNNLPIQGSPAARNYGFEIDCENLELLKMLSADDAGRWQLRIRSDPQIALRAGAAPNYWEGDLTVPLTLNQSPGEAPPKAWWTEETTSDE